MLCHKLPIASAVVHLSQMTQLVDDQVIDHHIGALDQLSVQREISLGGAGPPFRGLTAYEQLFELESMQIGKLFGSLCEVIFGMIKQPMADHSSHLCQVFGQMEVLRIPNRVSYHELEVVGADVHMPGPNGRIFDNRHRMRDPKVEQVGEGVVGIVEQLTCALILFRDGFLHPIAVVFQKG